MTHQNPALPEPEKPFRRWIIEVCAACQMATDGADVCAFCSSTERARVEVVPAEQLARMEERLRMAQSANSAASPAPRWLR